MRNSIVRKEKYGVRRPHSLLLSFAALFAFSCAANDGMLRSGKAGDPTNSANRKDPFVEDLDSMRTAGFPFVFVLRRKDGAKMNAEDRSIIKLQTVDMNRRVASDDDRAIIIGSHYQLPANNLAALYEKFSVENYSEPSADTNSNVNSIK